MDDETEARQLMGTVLIVEDDPALAGIVDAALRDEGYATSVVPHVERDAIRTAIGRLEPDCILLDSTGRGEYAVSWLEAEWAHTRRRAVPVVMFTTNRPAVREAEAGESDRSRFIHAVVAKPFDLDLLLDTVARAGAGYEKGTGYALAC